MKTLASLLSEAGRRWTGAGPASESDIAELKRAAGFTLPREYVELLRTCNGGEGELALPPLWFQLFDVPFAIQMASNDFYRRELDGLFLFGSNGGLETIALDMRGASPWPTLMVDCVAGLDSAVQIAESFSEFIDAIGRPAAMDEA